MRKVFSLPVRIIRYWGVFRRLGREAQERHGVSASQMMKEHMALRKLNRLRWHEYLFYRLFNPELAWEEKTAYIGQIRMRPLWSALNPLEYRYIFKNKLIFKQICLKQGLAVAPLRAVFDPDWGFTAEGAALRSVKDIEKWIVSLEDPNVVLKPSEGAEGRMVKAFRAKADGAGEGLQEVNETRWSARDLYDFMTDEEMLAQACSGGTEIHPTFLIEDRLRSHPELARLSPDTLCTFRIVTLLARGYEPQIVGSCFKLQTSSSGMDNMHQGSIGIDIRPDHTLGTGWTMPLAYYRREFDSLPPIQRCTRDPRSGVEFTGTKIPMWEETQDLVLRAAKAFPYVRCVGWDVAITPEGPRIVEGNWAWGEELTQGGTGRGIYRGDFKEVCEQLRREGKADKALV